jgi:hypothetical protein
VINSETNSGSKLTFTFLLRFFLLAFFFSFAQLDELIAENDRLTKAFVGSTTTAHTRALKVRRLSEQQCHLRQLRDKLTQRKVSTVEVESVKEDIDQHLEFAEYSTYGSPVTKFSSSQTQFELEDYESCIDVCHGEDDDSDILVQSLEEQVENKQTEPLELFSKIFESSSASTIADIILSQQMAKLSTVFSFQTQHLASAFHGWRLSTAQNLLDKAIREQHITQQMLEDHQMQELQTYHQTHMQHRYELRIAALSSVLLSLQQSCVVNVVDEAFRKWKSVPSQKPVQAILCRIFQDQLKSDARVAFNNWRKAAADRLYASQRLALQRSLTKSLMLSEMSSRLDAVISSSTRRRSCAAFAQWRSFCHQMQFRELHRRTMTNSAFLILLRNSNISVTAAFRSWRQIATAPQPVDYTPLIITTSRVHTRQLMQRYFHQWNMVPLKLQLQQLTGTHVSASLESQLLNLSGSMLRHYRLARGFSALRLLVPVAEELVHKDWAIQASPLEVFFFFC